MAAPASAGREAPRFIADCHLGRLAKYLRFMGYDTLYFPHIEDDDLLERAWRETRTVLTRDALLARRKNAPVYFLEPPDAAGQLRTLADAFGLTLLDDDAHRCLVCNARLKTVGKAAVGEAVPAAVQARFERFQRCPVCGRVYWHGDHYRRMTAFLRQALAMSV